MLRDKLINLREVLVSQAALVEKMIAKSIHGLLENENDTLNEVIGVEEKSVNELELRIDELCLETLALYHPEAKDLRLTTMISKMTSDLERMADCAVNIAESALQVINRPRVFSFNEIKKMADAASLMVKDSISSFIDEQGGLAKAVCIRDSLVDSLRDGIWQDLITVMACDTSHIPDALHLLRIANNLEKIADLATNIAEETVFLTEGRIMKHHKAESSEVL